MRRVLVLIGYAEPSAHIQVTYRYALFSQSSDNGLYFSEGVHKGRKTGNLAPYVAVNSGEVYIFKVLPGMDILLYGRAGLYAEFILLKPCRDIRINPDVDGGVYPYCNGGRLF